VQRHPLSERGYDLYGTPLVAIEALLRTVKLPHRLWEPACGHGNIATVLRAHGHEVVCSDVADHGFPLDFTEDFLKARQLPIGCEAVVTNPPYSLCARSAPFVQHALELSPIVALLLRLAFYESDARSTILEERGLRAIYVFRLRLPMMHRDGWQGRKANSGMAFAWFVWDRNYVGPTIISRISWDK
jgi:hypothetical protein